MCKSRFLKRRAFLRGVAGVSVGLPLLESIGAGPLQAQEAQPQKRFLSFHSSSGVDTDRFWPQIGALSAASFAGRGTEALASYADRLLVPRGVHGYPVGTWTGHSEGTCQALTAAVHTDTVAQGVSIDQVIAKAFNPNGREALVVRPGGRDGGVAGFNSISYRAAGQRAEAESNPYRTYRALMGMAPATTPNPSQPTDEAAQRLLTKRQSVIDLVRAEFEELGRIDLSQSDKEKLQMHFQLIRDVEVGMTQNPAVSCAFDAATVGQLEALDANTVEANANFPTVARLFVKLLGLALACGYTRSAVLQWGAAVAGSPTYKWDGMDHTFRHHPLSHGTTEDFNETKVDGYKDMLFAIDRWNIGEFVKLLDLLDSYAEGGGRSLLDNTLVLYTNEFSHGEGHTTGDLPVVIVGAKGSFQAGKSLLLTGSRADIAGVTGTNGYSHRLLCTVLNAVGVPTEQWNGGTELTELRAT